MNALDFLKQDDSLSASNFLHADKKTPGFMEKVRSFFEPTPTPDYLKVISGGIADVYESKPAQDLMTTLQAAGEVPIAAVTGIAGFFAGKAGGLAQSILGRPEEVSRETEERISEIVFIHPRTELGQRIVETLFAPFTALAGLGTESARLPAESWGVPEKAMYPVETAGELTAFALLPGVKSLIKQSIAKGKVEGRLVEAAKNEIIREQEAIIKVKESADKVRETKPDVAEKIDASLQPRIKNLVKAKESIAETGKQLAEPVPTAEQFLKGQAVEPLPEVKITPVATPGGNRWANDLTALDKEIVDNKDNIIRWSRNQAKADGWLDKWTPEKAIDDHYGKYVKGLGSASGKPLKKNETWRGRLVEMAGKVETPSEIIERYRQLDFKEPYRKPTIKQDKELLAALKSRKVELMQIRQVEKGVAETAAWDTSMLATKKGKGKPTTSPENLIGYIQSKGGIKLGEDYSDTGKGLFRKPGKNRELEFPDVKRASNSKTGKPMDEMVADLNAEGFRIKDADELMELLRSGQARNIFTPGRGDAKIEAQFRRQENERIEHQLADLEAEGIDAGRIRESEGDIQRIVFEETKREGAFSAANEEAALAELSNWFDKPTRFSKETTEMPGFTAAETFNLAGKEPPKGMGEWAPAKEKVKTAEIPGTGLSKLAAEQKQVEQAGRLVVGLEKKEPIHTFAAPETEKLFQSAKGIRPEGIVERIKAISIEVGHKITRDFAHLANKKENAQLIFDLKRLEKQKDVVADRTARSIGETLSGLGKADYNVFSRKVILDDLMSDYKRGLYVGDKDLPFKFTPDSLSAEIGKLDALISTNPKVGEALGKRQAMWEQVKDEYIEALGPYKLGVEDMFKENYYRHQVLDYVANNGVFGTGKRLRVPQKGYMKGRTGAANLYNTDYLEAEHQIMAQMLHDVETATTLTKIQVGEDIAKEIRAQAKVDGIADWHKAIPEGYKVWQPKEGSVFYPVLTVSEKTAERIMVGEMDGLLEGGGQIFRDALAVGGKRKEWVVRNEVAETLDNLVRERAKGLISSADLGVMTAWKKWQLISPRRYFKYNVRNLTGDAEAVFLGNIHGFTKAPQAVRELGEVFFQKKAMSPDMAAWFERGGMSSTLQAQEMDALRPMWMFSRLHEKKVGDLNLWKGYWEKARLTTDYRESILRYANFLDYKEQLIAGKGIPKNYGASKPEMINSLKDIDDKAYWLSNDLLGAYDRVSVAGQVIRERAIPFWSWQEVNFKRYVQLYKNAASDGDLAATVGKQLGAKTAIAALKVGRLAIKTAAFASALQVYNHSFFPEEEKILPVDMKSTPHIIFGRDDKGNIQYFNRMGTLDDFISWFGLDYAPRFIGEYLDGKKTMKELLQAQAKKTYEAPVNKVVQGAAPFMKLLAETISRKAVFPDVFQPGTIRDRWQHIARSVGLENEYALMAGKPSRGYGESLKNLFIYKIDPGEAAFRNVYDMKNDFMKKIGKTSEGFWLTPTGDALYNMKLSIKYDDKEAFSKYFAEYVSLAAAQGRTKEQIQQGIKMSIQTMHPLYGMNEKLKAAFIGSLNYEDQGTLAQAIGFYNEILQGNRQ